MKPVGQLVVLGFIVTPRFTCVLGNGDDAAAKISYEFKNDTVKFTLSPMTSDRKAKAVVTLVDSPSSRIKQVFVDGKNGMFSKKGDQPVAEGTVNSVIEFRFTTQ